ncbi:uncharacterized protein [Ambystoma mexicanum]|uniref:uncharacterized protein n=1 Tax=Ambystoma mexicanum TaxID=8296 RepID=UPI0037E84A6C
MRKRVSKAKQALFARDSKNRVNTIAKKRMKKNTPPTRKNKLEKKWGLQKHIPIRSGFAEPPEPLSTEVDPGMGTSESCLNATPKTLQTVLENTNTPSNLVKKRGISLKDLPARRLKWLQTHRQRKMFLKRLRKAKMIIMQRALKDLEAQPQNTPPPDETDAVFLQSMGTYQRDLPKFRSVEHYEVFRFINLDRLRSTGQGLLVITETTERLISQILETVGPNDFVQIRLDSTVLNRPLFTRRSFPQTFDVLQFLENIGKLLQSKAELVVTEPLRLVSVVVRAREGGVYRPLKKTLYSMVVSKKKRWLLDFNYGDLNICMAASIIGLLEPRTVTDGYIQARAMEVHSVLGIPPDVMVGFNDLRLFEDHFGVPIKILYNEDRVWKYFPAGDNVNKNTIYILHHEQHYYGILNLQSFLGARNLCPHCCHIYSNKTAHRCHLHCNMCQRDGCVVTSESGFKCPRCKTFARSKDCLQQHVEKAAQGTVVCHLKTDCSSCGRFIKANHECKGRICPRCDVEVVSVDEHQCYMTHPKEIAKTENYIIFDMECMQETGIHIPNYIYARHLTRDDRWSFAGIDCVSRFIKTFLTKKFHGYSFLAHNSQGYDGFFIIQQLIKERVDVKLITQGAKLKLLAVPDLKIRFIDSLNFLPMKLSKLPKAFGFPGSKGYFPHFFNTVQNQSYVGAIPPMECYGSEYMMPDDKEAFLKWYTEARTQVFDFKRELKAYCREDVNILRTACNSFRDGIIDMTRQVHTMDDPENPEMKIHFVTYVDPFTFITLASMCMHIYKQLFLKSETIALIPPDMYHGRQKRFSTPSIQWLMYMSEQIKTPIQHALRGGEKKIGPYFLDGYASLNGVQMAYEFNGCFYHGCPQCYKKDDYNTLMACTYDHLYRRTLLKKNFLETRGLRVITLWEHEWTEMLKKDSDLKIFLKHKNLPEPLEPRDALFGGRTNAIKLYHETAPGEKIHYLDFTSLYPFINHSKPYPLGHPRIIYENFGDIKQYFGLIKCQVYPPKKLYFPVLPQRISGKLMFPLCMACAESKQTEKCTHSDEERSITGTWCTVELEVALQKGYRLGKIHEIWHFENITVELFCEYIRMFLRSKQEASGYPEGCDDPAARQKYIDDYYTHQGIRLRPEFIENNPSRRQLAKLCLNSLWGKFAQRTNLPNTSIITDPDKLTAYLFDAGYDISSLQFIDEETACLCWKYAEEYPTCSNNINIFIACFTTAHARLELYTVMDALQERCLYHDTDSVIFVSAPGQVNPPLGDYLGNLTSELAPGEHIIEFVSAGPKTYSYRTSSGAVCMKVKGITLNVSNSLKINFDSLKELVREYTLENTIKSIVVQQPSIVREKKRWEISTQTLQKTLRVVFDKRVLTNDYKTLPYGY